MNPIGTLKILRRYPVKSMKGEDLPEAFVAYAGLAGDRVYAFVDPEKKTNFPWLTARQVSEMILFEPRFISPSPGDVHYPGLEQYIVMVKSPEGQEYRVDDPKFHEWLQTRWNRPFALRFSERGMQDSHPVSILGLESVKALGQEVGAELDHRRFRANFYVEWNHPESAYYEDQLLGKTLHIGEKLQVQITKKDTRCVIVNLDPATSEANPGVLKTVGQKHGGCIGVYAAVLREGLVRAGDEIRLA